MSKKPIVPENYRRDANLRQRLLRASRAVNTDIVEKLHARGFHELRSTHTALLSNLELGGSNLTNVARRAGITKQAMGRLADELTRLNYITRTRDKADRRIINLEFTQTGLDLMQQSFEIMDGIEKQCAARMGRRNFGKFLDMLAVIADEREQT